MPARLSPTWHGAVVGIVVLVLATGMLLPTALVGMRSPPLGVAVVVIEWLLLAWLLERMHLAARPATAPRRRHGLGLDPGRASVSHVVEDLGGLTQPW